MNNMKDEKTISAPTAHMIRMGDGAYISVVMNGESLVLRKNGNESAFDIALDAYKSKDWSALYTAMRPVKAFVMKMDGVSIENSTVMYNNEPIHGVVADRIVEFANNGLPYEPLCAFLNKLMQNPSSRAVNELYTFLEHKNLPITDNGNFLAYKKVDSNFYSMTRGSVKLLKGSEKDGAIFNGVGEEIEIPRNQVDDNKDIGCSYGLHAGTIEYAKSFGGYGNVVVVEINPTDVVSIPTDCSFQKLRCCKYKVVDHYTHDLTESLYESRVQEDYDSYPDDDCDECESLLEIERDLAYNESGWIRKIEWWQDGWLIITTYDHDIQYGDVPKQLVLDWVAHIDGKGSAGQFYNRFIKDRYPLQP